MKIKQVKVFQCKIPLIQPFVISVGPTDKLHSTIIQIMDSEGNVGWGEASPRTYVSGETPRSVLSALALILPRICNKDPRRLEKLTGLMDEVIHGNYAAKAAIDIALHDLLGNIYGEPIWRLLGGNRKEKIETDYTVSIATPEEMAEEAKKLVGDGFKILKIKLGDVPRKDVERIRGIQAAIGNNVQLRIDANQGWSRQETIHILREIADLNIEFAEQPIQAHDITGLNLIRQKVPVPIMADEAIHQPHDVIRIVEQKAADYINIKLMKSGGFLKAQKIAAIAEAANIPSMIGSMLATNLIATAATHFAAAIGNVQFQDLDTGTSLGEKLVIHGGAQLEGRYRTLSEAPGLGINKLNKDLLGTPVAIYEG